MRHHHKKVAKHFHKIYLVAVAIVSVGFLVPRVMFAVAQMAPPGGASQPQQFGPPPGGQFGPPPGGQFHDSPSQPSQPSQFQPQPPQGGGFQPPKFDGGQQPNQPFPQGGQFNGPQGQPGEGNNGPRPPRFLGPPIRPGQEQNSFGQNDQINNQPGAGGNWNQGRSGQQPNGNDDQMQAQFDAQQKQQQEMEQRQQQEMEKQQKRMEEMQKKQQERQLQQMKSGMKQMAFMLKQIRSRVSSIQKTGITVPSDIQTMIDSSQKDVDAIMNGTSMDDQTVQDAMTDLQSRQDDLRQAMQSLESLVQFSQQIKQAEKEVKRLTSALANAQKLAARSKVDVSQVLAQFQQAVLDITSSLEQAKASVTGGDVDAANQTLQDGVFGRLQDAYQYEGVIRMLQNVKSNISRFDSQLSRAKKFLARMQKKGEDTSDLSSAIDSVGTDLDQLKQLISQSNVDPGDLSDAISTLFGDQSQLQSLMGTNTNQFGANMQGPTKDFQYFQNFSLPFGGRGNGGGQAAPRGQDGGDNQAPPSAESSGQ